MSLPVFEISNTALNQDSGDLTLTFKFEANMTESDSLTGYYLNLKIDDETTLLDRFIDPANLSNPDGRFHFIRTDEDSGSKSLTYTFSSEEIPFNSQGYFYLTLFRKDSSYINFSQEIIYTFPFTQPIDFNAYYDGYRNVMVAELPDERRYLKEIVFEKAEVTRVDRFEVRSTAYIGTLISSIDFVRGDWYIVHDTFNELVWYGKCLKNQFIFLSDSNLFSNAKGVPYHNYKEVYFTIYKVSEIDFTEYTRINLGAFSGSLGIATKPDDSFRLIRSYFSGTKTINRTQPSLVRSWNLTQKRVSLYPIQSSEDPLIGNYFFTAIRGSLVDGNFYKKDTYSLPYRSLGSGDYSLKGYCGVGFAKIVTIVDDSIYSYSTADSKGEFDITFNSDNKFFSLNVIAKTSNKQKQSLPLLNTRIDKVLLYNSLATTSKELSEVQESLASFEKDLNIETCSIRALENFYGPLVGLERYSDESEELYRTQVTFLNRVLLRYEDVSINMIHDIINFYKDLDVGINGYLLSPSGWPEYDGFKAELGDTYIANFGKLSKKKYTYYVSVIDDSSVEKESYPVSNTLDYRSFNGPDIQNYPPVYLSWDGSDVDRNTYSFRIYREEDDGLPKLIVPSIKLDRFIDDGGTNRSSQTFTDMPYNDIPTLEKLNLNSTTTLMDSEYLRYSRNTLVLNFYTNGISSNMKKRLTQLLEKITPKSIFLTINFI